MWNHCLRHSRLPSPPREVRVPKLSTRWGFSSDLKENAWLGSTGKISTLSESERPQVHPMGFAACALPDLCPDCIMERPWSVTVSRRPNCLTPHSSTRHI